MTASLAPYWKKKGKEKKDPFARKNDDRGRTRSTILYGHAHLLRVHNSKPIPRVVHGRTNDLARRVIEHQQGYNEGFTSRYRVTRLVYFEEFADIREAIAREKTIKGWKRSRKIGLIEGRNPTWEDLSIASPAPAAVKKKR